MVTEQEIINRRTALETASTRLASQRLQLSRASLSGDRLARVRAIEKFQKEKAAARKQIGSALTEQASIEKQYGEYAEQKRVYDAARAEAAEWKEAAHLIRTGARFEGTPSLRAKVKQLREEGMQYQTYQNIADIRGAEQREAAVRDMELKQWEEDTGGNVVETSAGTRLIYGGEALTPTEFNKKYAQPEVIRTEITPTTISPNLQSATYGTSASVAMVRAINQPPVISPTIKEVKSNLSILGGVKNLGSSIFGKIRDIERKRIEDPSKFQQLNIELTEKIKVPKVEEGRDVGQGGISFSQTYFETYGKAQKLIRVNAPKVYKNLPVFGPYTTKDVVGGALWLGGKQLQAEKKVADVSLDYYKTIGEVTFGAGKKVLEAEKVVYEKVPLFGKYTTRDIARGALWLGGKQLQAEKKVADVSLDYYKSVANKTRLAGEKLFEIEKKAYEDVPIFGKYTTKDIVAGSLWLGGKQLQAEKKVADVSLDYYKSVGGITLKAGKKAFEIEKKAYEDVPIFGKYTTKDITRGALWLGGKQLKSEINYYKNIAGGTKFAGKKLFEVEKKAYENIPVFGTYTSKDVSKGALWLGEKQLKTHIGYYKNIAGAVTLGKGGTIFKAVKDYEGDIVFYKKGEREQIKKDTLKELMGATDYESQQKAIENLRGQGINVQIQNGEYVVDTSNIAPTSKLGNIIVRGTDLFFKGKIFAPFLQTAAYQRGGTKKVQVKKEETEVTSGGRFRDLSDTQKDNYVRNVRYTYSRPGRGNQYLRDSLGKALRKRDKEAIEITKKIIRDILGEEEAGKLISDVTSQEGFNLGALSWDNRFVGTSPSGKITNLGGDLGKIGKLGDITSGRLGGVDLTSTTPSPSPTTWDWAKSAPTLEVEIGDIFNIQVLKKIPEVLSTGALFTDTIKSDERVGILQPAIQLQPPIQNQPPIITTISSPSSGSDSRSGISQAQPPIQIQPQSPIQIQPVIQTQILRQQQKQQQKQQSQFKFPLGFGLDSGGKVKLTPSLLGKIKQAYEVKVRREGTFKTIAKGLPKGQALKLGAQKTISTLAATFKIVPKGTTTKEDIDYTPSPLRFRKPKSGEKLTFVEKKTQRIKKGTGEIGEILKIRGNKPWRTGKRKRRKFL